MLNFTQHGTQLPLGECNMQHHCTAFFGGNIKVPFKQSAVIDICMYFIKIWKEYYYPPDS